MPLSSLTQFHENPAVIARWRAWTGPLLRALTPGRRRWILAAGAAYVAIANPLEDVADVRAFMGGAPGPVGAALVVLALAAFVGFAWWAARRLADWPSLLRRHPQVCLHATFWILLAIVWATASVHGPWRAALACLVATVPFLLWRLGYMLMAAQRRTLKGSFLRDHLFYLWPAWGGSATPYGKGTDYLSACEAKDEEALARSQLAGVKLLVLSLTWSVAQGVLDGLVMNEPNDAFRAVGVTLGLPRLQQLLEGTATASVPVAWSVIYLELFHEVLRLAAKGHLIVGSLRLMGFNVFRNTYKPLLAETVVEFWNRYYYYFKELLAQFFFFPVFARSFKSRPTLRMAAAVFAAAFLGNMYYHLLPRERELLEMDGQGLWVHLGSRLFYCLLLASGIFVSMWREQRRAGRPRGSEPWRRWAAILGVWTFFALIHVWSAPAEATPLPRARFFLSLLGIS